MTEGVRNEKVHSMKRRSLTHDYSRKGIYHITISVAKGLRQPLGRMAGDLTKPDGDKDAPHVELTPIGKMVEEELKGSIQRFYPMLEVMDYVVMPEHLHFLIVAHDRIVSRSGRSTHLGAVIGGFKQGCNKRYWALTGMIKPGDRQDLATKSPGAIENRDGGAVQNRALGGSATKGEQDAGSTRALGGSATKGNGALPPLFDAGYCDVIPVDEGQLETQRAYIHANPRNRLMRMMNRERFSVMKGRVNTAVSVKALRGYLERECPKQMSDEIFAEIEKRLIVKDGRIMCDCYGCIDLLSRRLLPVVCHRKDKPLFGSQKERCLEEAKSGAVLVSARISKGEQEIMDVAHSLGCAVIRIMDNGFPEIYHPSAERIDDCTKGLLLLLSPWSFVFRGVDEGISVAFCKTMNCIAQAICKLKDDWWKQ